MWTKTKSLILSRILVTAFTALLVLIIFSVPFFAVWYDGASEGYGLISGSIVIPTCIILYICDALAFAAVVALHILLRNISVDRIFDTQNTKCLRIISWACIFAGFAFVVLGLWQMMCFIPAFFAIMFGLIMRVLKNVFEQAVEIKCENDFTV